MTFAAFYRKSDGSFAVATHGSEADIALNAPTPPEDYLRFDDVADFQNKAAAFMEGEWVLVDRTETLAQAQRRRIGELKAEGISRVKARFPAINNFDELRLVQQIITSIAPAARQPTTDIAWLGQMWTAGSNAVTAVNAATTIPQVDAVTAAWPAT